MSLSLSDVHRVGWSVEEAGLGLGEAPLSYGFGSTGKGVVNNQYNEYGEAYGVDDVITCMLVRAHHLFFIFADPVNIFASLSLLQDLESSPPSISFACNGNHLGMAFTLDEDKVKGQTFFPHVTTKNVVVTLNFKEVRNLAVGEGAFLSTRSSSLPPSPSASPGPTA